MTPCKAGSIILSASKPIAKEELARVVRSVLDRFRRSEWDSQSELFGPQLLYLFTNPHDSRHSSVFAQHCGVGPRQMDCRAIF